MLHTCAVRFYVTEILKNFVKLLRSKQGSNIMVFSSGSEVKVLLHSDILPLSLFNCRCWCTYHKFDSIYRNACNI